MNYGIAEQEIVDRLNSQFAGNNLSDKFEAALMPDTEADFQKFYNNFNKARVAVAVIDIQPQPSVSMGAVCQDEIVKFRLSFEAKKMRGPGGLYTMMQLTKLFLVGFRPSDCSKLSFTKYGMVEFEVNSWQPYFEFECKTTFTEAQNNFGDDAAFVPLPPEVMSLEFQEGEFQ